MKRAKNHSMLVLIIISIILVIFVSFSIRFKNNSSNKIEKYVNEKYNLKLKLVNTEKNMYSYGDNGGTWNYTFYFENIDGTTIKGYLNTGYKDEINDENLKNISLELNQ